MAPTPGAGHLSQPSQPSKPNLLTSHPPPRHPASHSASSGHIDGATVSRHGRRAILSRRNHVWAHWSRSHFWTHGSRGFGCVSHLSRNGCAAHVSRNACPQHSMRKPMCFETVAPGLGCALEKRVVCFINPPRALDSVLALCVRFKPPTQETPKPQERHENKQKTPICSNNLKTTWILKPHAIRTRAP